MEEIMTQWGGTPFPEFIRKLPEVEIAVPGIRGWLLQGAKGQAVFFDIGPGVRVPVHSHCAQWGIVVEGEMSLTIAGRVRTYRKGDWYAIAAGEEHAAEFITRVNVIDVFEDPARYKPRA
jgi:quercetin dioxygenase-like cupin family protein